MPRSRRVDPRPRPPGPPFTVGLRTRHPGSVHTGTTSLGGALGDRRVALFQTDAAVRRGALSESDGEAIANAAATALRARCPLVGIIASSGADVTEGLPALHGWGRAARSLARCSGVVPIVLIVDGPAVSGPALLLGLADLVVMTNPSYSFVSGPAMVADFTGLTLDNQTLGGAAAHARQSGVAALVADDLDGALELAAAALAYLPDSVDVEPDDLPTDDPVDRDCPELDALVPATSTGSYDVRKVIEAISDDGVHLELRARWASNLVTSFASVGGQPVGVVANQPVALAGTLDIPAAQKGAWFVALCDAFNLPIVTLVDTPGYFPGKDLEWRGMIRHGAQMAFAYAEASVPRVCVVLRKAYGGAYIVMDCKSMGNDVCLAWPSAELAVMGAKGAVQILHRRETDEVRLQREVEYGETYLNPYVAAERGYVDAVIEPAATRAVVAQALGMLRSKREALVGRRHGNSPL